MKFSKETTGLALSGLLVSLLGATYLQAPAAGVQIAYLPLMLGLLLCSLGAFSALSDAARQRGSARRGDRLAAQHRRRIPPAA